MPMTPRLSRAGGVGDDGLDFGLSGGQAVEFLEGGFGLLTLLCQFLQTGIHELAVGRRDVVQEVAADARDALLLGLGSRLGLGQVLALRARGKASRPADLPR